MISNKHEKGGNSTEDNNLTKFSLASFDADCLLHIFTFMPLRDAFYLGFTCRRLYNFFEKTRKTTRAVSITSIPSKLVLKAIFVSNIDSNANDEVEKKYSSKLISFILPPLRKKGQQD